MPNVFEELNSRKQTLTQKKINESHKQKQESEWEQKIWEKRVKALNAFNATGLSEAIIMLWLKAKSRFDSSEVNLLYKYENINEQNIAYPNMRRSGNKVGKGILTHVCTFRDITDETSNFIKLIGYTDHIWQDRLEHTDLRIILSVFTKSDYTEENSYSIAYIEDGTFSFESALGIQNIPRAQWQDNHDLLGIALGTCVEHPITIQIPLKIFDTDWGGSPR